MGAVTGTTLLIYALIAVIALVILIARFKLNPFITLVVVSVLLGFAVGMPMGDIIKSFEAGVGGTLGHIALVIGLGYGAIAGLAGGWVERLMVRVLDVFSALPFLLVVILLLTLFERSLLLLLAAIGGYVWIDLARVMRAEAARLREAPFVLAAQAAGASFGQRLRWHVLPNLMPLAFVYLGLILPQAILVESFLGFLGLSIDEPSSSWGGLLAEGVQELDSAPWTLLFPAGFLVTTLAAFQFLGDGLRDWLDVHRSPQGDAPRQAAAA